MRSFFAVQYITYQWDPFLLFTNQWDPFLLFSTLLTNEILFAVQYITNQWDPFLLFTNQWDPCLAAKPENTVLLASVDLILCILCALVVLGDMAGRRPRVTWWNNLKLAVLIFIICKDNVLSWFIN